MRAADMALQSDPAFGEAYHAQGRAWREMGEPTLAEERLREALRLVKRNSELADIHNEIGLCGLKLGDATKARDHFDKAISLKP